MFTTTDGEDEYQLIETGYFALVIAARIRFGALLCVIDVKPQPEQPLRPCNIHTMA